MPSRCKNYKYGAEYIWIYSDETRHICLCCLYLTFFLYI
nr:MAG TPA: hypothetical protein [Bacteriophage sp.]